MVRIMEVRNDDGPPWGGPSVDRRDAPDYFFAAGAFAAGAFAAGALAASTGAMNPVVLVILLFVAAVLGDTLNYHIGKFIGPRVFEMESRLINRQHLDYTQKFFEKHGGKTIIFARFVPFARTFAPFVAGAGHMNYKFFLTYNLIGAICWVGSFVTLGYLFGNMPIVKDNFTYLIFGIIIISVLPGIVGFIRQRLKKRG